jgi:hypothetical protein
MLRIAGGVVGGVIAWFVLATIGNLAIRLSWAEYVAVEKSLDFSLAMLVTRLVLGAACSLAAGVIAAWIGRGHGAVVKGAGILLTLLFIPVHYQLWDKFPLWYHAVFLISLFPLTLLGASLFARGRRPAVSPQGGLGSQE